jgi:hypothetical protein
MMMEKLVEWWLAWETEVFGENLPQCRFVYHKPHMSARTRTQASAVGSQRLTAWTTARPSFCLDWRKWAYEFTKHPISPLQLFNQLTNFCDIFHDLRDGMSYDSLIICKFPKIVIYKADPRTWGVGATLELSNPDSGIVCYRILENMSSLWK